jgi:hypothetical protein
MSTATIPKSDEVSESLDQWVKFCSTVPNQAHGGEIIKEPGLVMTISRTLWPLGNIAVFTTRINSVDDLACRVERAHDALTARGCAGVFCVADNLVESLRLEVPTVFARHGYVPAMTITGMATDGLAAPVRPLPPLEHRTVSDPATRRVVCELNAMAYEVPLDWGRDFDERTDVWSHGAVGIIGYLNDRPAACAATVPVDGRLYVALVATAHEFRRQGCAEAVMRRSLQDAMQETGLSRTVLHGSPMGRPLYLRMGYHDTVPFTVYAAAH